MKYCLFNIAFWGLLFFNLFEAAANSNIYTISGRVTEAKTNFVNALYDYNTSKIALETSMGVPVAVTAAANTTNLPTMSTETAAE